jgi:hypothetical protein
MPQSGRLLKIFSCANYSVFFKEEKEQIIV